RRLDMLGSALTGRHWLPKPKHCTVLAAPRYSQRRSAALTATGPNLQRPLLLWAKAIAWWSASSTGWRDQRAISSTLLMRLARLAQRSARSRISGRTQPHPMGD